MTSFQMLKHGKWKLNTLPGVVIHEHSMNKSWRNVIRWQATMIRRANFDQWMPWYPFSGQRSNIWWRMYENLNLCFLCVHRFMVMLTYSTETCLLVRWPARCLLGVYLLLLLQRVFFLSAEAYCVLHVLIRSSKRYQRQCRLCENTASTAILLPCGHHTLCEACSRKEEKCSTCKKKVERYLMPGRFATARTNFVTLPQHCMLAAFAVLVAFMLLAEVAVFHKALKSS